MGSGIDRRPKEGLGSPGGRWGTKRTHRIQDPRKAIDWPSGPGRLASQYEKTNAYATITRFYTENCDRNIHQLARHDTKFILERMNLDHLMSERDPKLLGTEKRRRDRSADRRTIGFSNIFRDQTIRDSRQSTRTDFSSSIVFEWMEIGNGTKQCATTHAKGHKAGCSDSISIVLVRFALRGNPKH